MDAHHHDAFRLITYRNDNHVGQRELVWNARTGKAPRFIQLPDGDQARRVDVQAPYLPDHIPQVGHIVLIDCTVDWAEERAERLALRMWSAGQTCDQGSQDELEAYLLSMFMNDAACHYGTAVVVDGQLATQRGWLISA